MLELRTVRVLNSYGRYRPGRLYTIPVMEACKLAFKGTVAFVEPRLERPADVVPPPPGGALRGSASLNRHEDRAAW
jgi:hypothetical protein